MKSITYYGSGYSETIMNIGDNWPLMDSALSMAIDGYIKNYKRLIKEVYKNKSMETMGFSYIQDCKRSIRTLQKIKRLLEEGKDNPYTYYDSFLEAIR